MTRIRLGAPDVGRIGRYVDGSAAVGPIRRAAADAFGIDDADARAFVTRLLRSVVEDVGGRYADVMTARLNRIVELRGRIDDAFHSVLSGDGRLPPGVTIPDLRQWLAELDLEMDAIVSPHRYLDDADIGVPDGAVRAARGDGDAASSVDVPTVRPQAASAARPALGPGFVAATADLPEAARARAYIAVVGEPDLPGRIARAETEGQRAAAIGQLDRALERAGLTPDQRRAVLGDLTEQNRTHQRTVDIRDRAAAAVRLADEVGAGPRTEPVTTGRDLLSGLAAPDLDTPVGRSWNGLPPDQRARLVNLADEAPGATRQLFDPAATPDQRARATADLHDAARRSPEHPNADLDVGALTALADADRISPRTRTVDAQFDADFARALRAAPVAFRRRAAALPFIRNLFADWQAGTQRTGEDRITSTFNQYVDRINRTAIRGALGEITASLGLGEGFVFLKAPKDNVTARGTDMVAVDVETGRTLVIDNKALSAPGSPRRQGDFEGSATVSDVSALTRNLERNLAADLTEFRGILHLPDTPPHVADRIDGAIRNLHNALQEIRALPAELIPTGREIEIGRILDRHNIERTVTNSAGDVDRISARLQAFAFVLRDMEMRGPRE